MYVTPIVESTFNRVQAQDEEAPVLAAILSFLAQDVARHPERLQALDVNLPARIDALVGNVAVSLAEPLSADNE